MLLRGRNITLISVLFSVVTRTEMWRLQKVYKEMYQGIILNLLNEPPTYIVAFFKHMKIAAIN